MCERVRVSLHSTVCVCERESDSARADSLHSVTDWVEGRLTLTCSHTKWRPYPDSLAHRNVTEWMADSLHSFTHMVEGRLTLTLSHTLGIAFLAFTHE